jgi:hypothetical protein
VGSCFRPPTSFDAGPAARAASLSAGGRLPSSGKERGRRSARHLLLTRLSRAARAVTASPRTLRPAAPGRAGPQGLAPSRFFSSTHCAGRLLTRTLPPRAGVFAVARTAAARGPVSRHGTIADGVVTASNSGPALRSGRNRTGRGFDLAQGAPLSEPLHETALSRSPSLE